jgi:hypothetical protein
VAFSNSVTYLVIPVGIDSISRKPDDNNSRTYYGKPELKGNSKLDADDKMMS